MSSPVENDLAALLARAFVRAWERYYQSGRSETVAEEIARPALAKQMVAMAKKGVEDETALADSGLEYLISLTPEPRTSAALRSARADAIDSPSSSAVRDSGAFHLRIERPDARFLAQWRIPWGFVPARSQHTHG